MSEFSKFREVLKDVLREKRQGKRVFDVLSALKPSFGIQEGIRNFSLVAPVMEEIKQEIGEAEELEITKAEALRDKILSLMLLRKWSKHQSPDDIREYFLNSSLPPELKANLLTSLKDRFLKFYDVFAYAFDKNAENAKNATWNGVVEEQLNNWKEPLLHSEFKKEDWDAFLKVVETRFEYPRPKGITIEQALEEELAQTFVPYLDDPLLFAEAFSSGSKHAYAFFEQPMARDKISKHVSEFILVILNEYFQIPLEQLKEMAPFANDQITELEKRAQPQ